MTMKRFYHRCFIALTLATLAVHPILAATPVTPNERESIDLGMKLPPRSINDITRMLSDYKQNDDLVKHLISIADANPPDSNERKQLFEFYLRRGQAAAELGRVQQNLADLRLTIVNGQTGSPEYARALRNLAQAEVQGGNYMSAFRHVEDAIKQIPQTSRGQLTGAYMHMVVLSAQIGDMEMASKYLSELESTLLMLKSGRGWNTWSHFWLSNYERARGELFLLSGKAVEAEGAFRKALRESHLAIADLPGLISSGQDVPTPEIMQMFTETMERGIATSLLNQNKLVEAEAMARTALEHTIKRTGRTSPDVARGLRILSQIIAEQGRYAESAKLSEAALEILVQSGSTPDSLPVLSAHKANLTAQVALGNDRKALEIHEKIRSLVADKPDLSAKILRGDLDVVQAYLRTGQPAPAEKMAAAMLRTSIEQQGENSNRSAEIRAYHAMALADLGKNEEALTGFRKAVPLLVDQARNDTEAETSSTRRQHRLVMIIERYIRLLADLQAGNALPAGLDAANESFTLADFARGSSVQRALTRSAARAAINDPALASLAREEQDAQRRINSLNDLLSQLLGAPPDQQLPVIQGKIRQDIDRLKARRAVLKKEIGERFPDYARLVDPPPVNLKQVQKMLQAGEVMVSWYFGQQGAQLWAVNAKGQQLFTVIKTQRKQIAEDVRLLRLALSPEVATIDEIPPFDVKTAHRLYQDLLAPAADILKDARILLAVPHAELGQLPLSLLLTTAVNQPGIGAGNFAAYKTMPWLMQKMAVAQLPSVTALASLRQLPDAPGDRLPFIGFGDPYFSEEQATLAEKKKPATQVAMRGLPLKLRNVPKTQAVDSAELALLPRLPDTADEIREIAAALGAEPSRDLFLNRAASEKNVFEANLANRRVVMFATHGLIPGELDGLSQPALALSSPKLGDGEGDGLLTQEEILSLKLNADWVVLSACNTAAGEGAGSEAVSGLGRAFFFAGARALLVSNWPVETEAARSLMTSLFRRQAAASSSGKAEALRLAMQEMVNGPGKTDTKTGKTVFSYAHPLFWAPFVLVGD